MTLTYHILSLLIGFFFIEIIIKSKTRIETTFKICLSYGLGLGLSGLFTFFLLVLLGKYNRIAIITCNFSFLFILFYLYLRKLKNNTNKALLVNTFQKHITTKNLFFLLFLLLTILSLYFTAKRLPFGRWDAWALYNMKTKFLIFGESAWKSIFSDLHWHTQPGYPLLLPLINTSSYAFYSHSLNLTCLSSAIAMAFSCGLLLYGSLKQFTSKHIAILGSAVLLTNPIYQSLSTAQYADILLAFYLLASISTLILAIKSKDAKIALLSGLFLGLMTFTKNEGIALAFLLTIPSLFFIFLSNKVTTTSKKLAGFLILGLFATAITTILFKIFFAPPNPDIFPANSPGSTMQFFNMSGLNIIFNFAIKEMLYKGWCFIWPLLLIMLIIKPLNLFKKENVILTIFFVLYAIVLILIYLTTINFDLTWRLESTLRRIMFYLLPSILFFGFFVHGRFDDNCK